MVASRHERRAGASRYNDSAIMQPAAHGSILCFGVFELDSSTGELRRSGVLLKLRPQAARVLALLASRSGELVTRAEIQNEIWSSDLSVDFDQGLNFCIRQIRNALGDHADAPRFIETVPRRGYRFLVPVRTHDFVAVAVEPEGSLPQEESSERALPEQRDGRRPAAAAAVFLAAICLVTLIAVALAGYGRTEQQASASGGQIRSIAVLPLANLSGDPQQEYFADGMTEALIGQLSALRDVRVVSRTSVMQFKQPRKPVPAIAKELNVDALVEGSVLRSADRVRISVRLVGGRTDENVWADVYERPTSDVLGLQAEVAQAITRQIQSRLGARAAAVPAATRTVAPDVYEAYLKGRFYLHQGGRAAVEESVQHLQRAIEGDRGFAQAYSALGLAYIAFGFSGTAVSAVADAQPKALAAARKAIELDPNLAEAHTVVAATLERDWQWTESEKEYRRALDLDPNNTRALSDLGDLLDSRTRTDEGLVHAKRARELDPLSLSHSAQIGWLLYQARRYDEAARELRTVLTLEPNQRQSRWFLAFILIEKGQFDEAIRLLEQALAQSGRNPAELGVLARAYAQAGRREDALDIVSELRRRGREGYVPPAPFVHAYVGLADYDQAFAWLERAFEEHSNIIRYLRTHPMFDPIRGDARFVRLCQRAGL